jgi:hypothetical protein
MNAPPDQAVEGHPLRKTTLLLATLVLLIPQASCVKQRAVDLGNCQVAPTTVDPAAVSTLRLAASTGDTNAIRSALALPGAPPIDWRFKGRCQTALAVASEANHLVAVRLLATLGADPNVPDRTGAGPLMWASTLGRSDLVRALLDAGANPNGVNERDGWVPLICAADRGHLEVVKILLEAGADVNAQIVDGNTATFWARQNGHADVAAYLRSRGGKEPELSWAARRLRDADARTKSH